MATLEETRYIANTVVPESVNSVTDGAGSFMENIPFLVWLLVIGILVGIIIKFSMQIKKNTKKLYDNMAIIENFSHSSSSIAIEKVFGEICTMAGSEYLAMYTHRDDWYGLAFEIKINRNEKAVSIPLLMSENEVMNTTGKSGNFFITTFIEKDKKSVIKMYTRDKPIDVNSDMYHQVQILCTNGIKLHTLIASECSIERQSRLAQITTKLSSSFLSWQYDRERFFFFIANIIIKSVHSLEVVIHDEKNNITFNYGKKGAEGIVKEFYIHHSGCRMSIVTEVALDSVQLNTIGGFVDSSYSLFVQEEDNLKHAEQFLQFLIHSNDAMELEFPYFAHHSQMVEVVACRLAKSLNIDSKTLGNLKIAAKIHDIGMIADVSFSLGKEDKLTESEMDTIRNHPLYGSIIVEPLKQIYQIGDLIKYHHERYDGQGYPLGLLGDEISLPAQILGFAEHFTGLISDRSYRAGYPFEKAVIEVKKLSGQAFNPIVIRAFEQEENAIFVDLSVYKPNLAR